MPSGRRRGAGRAKKKRADPWDRPVAFFKGLMVLPPVPPPLTTATPTATTTTTTPTARLGGRAGGCGNRSGQCGDADGRSDRRSHRADAPKHRNRYSCDGLSQQLARCQKTFHHSAHPSFLSSHLRFFKQAVCETLGCSTATDDRAAVCIPCALSHAFSLGKDRRDPHLGSSSSPDQSARWHKHSIRMEAYFAKDKMG